MSIERNQSGQFVKGTHWREPKLFREKAWLLAHYRDAGRSAGDIAREFGVTPAAIMFWLRKHGIKRRSISEARGLKHWGVSGPDNPMWNKRGELSPNWLGGVTPERQAFYSSREWKDACQSVWKRDDAMCQRCGLDRRTSLDVPFHIHHIESFADRELRAVVSNLILLCEICHKFVHSRRNVGREFLSQKRNTRTPSRILRAG